MDIGNTPYEELQQQGVVRQDGLIDPSGTPLYHTPLLPRPVAG